MSLDERKWKRYDELFPEASLCISQSNSMTNSLPCYEYLYKLKPNIPTELFAYYFRNLLQMNTGNVSPELRLKMFEGLNPEDLIKTLLYKKNKKVYNFL